MSYTTVHMRHTVVGQVVLEMPKMSLYLVAVMILILVKLLLKNQ